MPPARNYNYYKMARQARILLFQSLSLLCLVEFVLLAPAHEHFYYFGIVVVEKEAFAGVKTRDFSHVCIAESKIENVKILFHSLDVGGFGYDYNVTLQKPAQGHLCHALAIFRSD